MSGNKAKDKDPGSTEPGSFYRCERPYFRPFS